MFFSDGDYLIYLHWLREYAWQFGIDVLAYALMPNHVHLILVPDRRDSLPNALRQLHARYAQRVNRKRNWVGHLWQARYFAAVLDEPYFWAAIRYVERNPVRAGIVEHAEEYAWSSAGAHCGLRHDPALDCSTRWRRLLAGVTDWSAWLAEGDEPLALRDLRVQTAKSLPCGSPEFVESLETSTGRVLHARHAGRPIRN